MIGEAFRSFLFELDKNNNREWFDVNKSRYQKHVVGPMLELIGTVDGALSQLSPALRAEPKVNGSLRRIYRDTRFSKDKTPYNTHLHIMWQVQSAAPQNPVFFFGIGADYVSAGAGLMGFEKPMLTNWRDMLDLDTERMLGIFARLESAGFRFREPALKRCYQY